MRGRACVVLAAIVLLPVLVRGQQKRMQDSLEHLLRQTTQDTSRADLLLQLVEVTRIFDTTAAQTYLRELERLRPRLRDQRRTAILDNLWALYYHLRGQYDLARTYALRAAAGADGAQDNRLSAMVYGLIGNIALETGRREEALQSFQRELELSLAAHDTASVGKSYTDLSCIFSDAGDHMRANHYSREALRWYVAGRINGGIAVSAQNMVGFFLSHGDSTISASASTDSALLYARIAQNVIDRSVHSTALAFMYYNVARIFEQKQMPDSALVNYRAAFEEFHAAGEAGSIGFQVRALLSISSIYFDRHLRDSASAVLAQAADIVKTSDNNRQSDELYGMLATGYATLGDYGTAFTYLDRSAQLHDSLFGAEKTKMLANIDALYQSSQKEKQIAEQSQELRKQGMLNYGAIGLGLLLVAFVGLMVRNNRQQQRANAELAAATARAEESERYEQQFLANMSHEIRTPMNAVLGMTTLLLDTPVTPKQHEYLDAMKVSSENLLVIINDILDVSKLREGKMELEAVPMRLRDVIGHVARTMQYKAAEKQIALRTTIDDAVPEAVIGDPGRLGQVIMNLVGNAIKFTQHGAVDVGVRVLEHDSEHVTIECEVRDTGIGIEAEKLDSIFESFRQAEAGTTRKFGGTGLGLSISKTLVELMQSQIHVESTPGAGSVFSFAVRFPLARPEDVAASPAAAAVASDALSGIRILLAEDNEYNQIVLVDTLKHLIPQVQIEIANNGLDAVTKCSEGAFDIVLMDVQMPVMDGLEATRRIRALADQAKQNIPVIALTASIVKGDIDQCLAAGMNAYVPKPFRREELLRALSYHSQKPRGAA